MQADVRQHEDGLLAGVQQDRRIGGGLQTDAAITKLDHRLGKVGLLLLFGCGEVGLVLLGV